MRDICVISWWNILTLVCRLYGCRIMWTEGGAQSGLESAVGLTFGFPAVAALSKVRLFLNLLLHDSFSS